MCTNRYLRPSVIPTDGRSLWEGESIREPKVFNQEEGGKVELDVDKATSSFYPSSPQKRS